MRSSGGSQFSSGSSCLELPVNDTNKIEHGVSEGAWNLYKAGELFKWPVIDLQIQGKDLLLVSPQKYNNQTLV